MHRPIQTAVLGTVEMVYKSLAPVEQNELEFLYLETAIPISIYILNFTYAVKWSPVPGKLWI